MQLFNKVNLLCCAGRKNKEQIFIEYNDLSQNSQDQQTTDDRSGKIQKKTSKQRNLWQKEEDLQLLELFKEYPQNWQQISKYMKTRTGKQIRDRYINALDPAINRSEWQHKEDIIILEKYIQFGSKWSIISQYLQGRPENMIKNRFYSSIKKRIGKGDFGDNFENKVSMIQENEDNQQQDNFNEIRIQDNFEQFNIQDLQKQYFNDDNDKNFFDDNSQNYFDNFNKFQIQEQNINYQCTNFQENLISEKQKNYMEFDKMEIEDYYENFVHPNKLYTKKNKDNFYFIQPQEQI